jgi:Ca2+-binding RTX toxin-like protein
MTDVTVAFAGTPEAATADFVCDGISDEAQINAAISYVESSGGGTVYLDPGTYNISTNILVHDTQNINLVGAGPDQTVIKTAADFSYTQSPDFVSRGAVSFYNVQNFDCEGIFVDARSGTSPENSDGLGILNGLEFASCSNGTVQNCTSYIHPGWSYAIWSRESDHLQILNNLVKGAESYAASQAEQEGIELYNGSNIVVSGNTIENIGGSGIFLFSPNSANELHDIQIVDNNVSGTTWGIRLAHEGPRSVENVTISGNKLTDIGGIGIDLWNVANGNFSTPGPPASVDNPQHIENIIIDGNAIDLADRSDLAMFRPDIPKEAIDQAIGIYLDNETAPGEAFYQNIQVTNNHLKNTSVENGSIFVTNYSNFALQSNVIEDADPGAQGDGISISGSSNFSVDENSIDGFGADGLSIQSSSHFTSNNNSIGGWTETSGIGLDIHSSADFQATQNEFRVDTASSQLVATDSSPVRFAGSTVYSPVDYVLTSSVVSSIVLVEGSGAIAATGNSQDNVIQGNSNANVLMGGDGNDTMIGGAGNDIYEVRQAGDVVIENPNEGTDTIWSSVNYSLPANVEKLYLTEGATTAMGNGLDNVIDATYDGSTANVLMGGDGNDTMIGGAGNDIYEVRQAGDVVIENPNEGTDTIWSSVNYSLSANVEKLYLTEGAANAVGNQLDNVIDLSHSSAASKTIDGGAGADTLTGGGGHVEFVFHAGQADGDTIVDFNASGSTDHITFYGYGTGATFTEVGNTNEWMISYNAGTSHETITFQNGALLHSSDFLFA